MSDRPTLSIVIVSFNTRDLTRKCLNLVKVLVKDIDAEILVVDNASRDESAAMVAAEFPEIRLFVSSINLGFAGGNNIALREARGRYLLLLNTDAFPFADTIPATLAYMEQDPRCGVLGVKLVCEDGTVQPSARMLPTPWRKFCVMTGIAARYPQSRIFGGVDFLPQEASAPFETGWVPGAYFLIRREVANTIGFLDERYFLYYEETDYCLNTVRAGWTTVYYPLVSCIHLGGVSSDTVGKLMSKSGKQLLHLRVQSEFRYYRKNHGLAGVLLSAGVELFWKGVVWLKNSLSGSEEAKTKKEEAAIVMGHVWRMLWADRFGSRTDRWQP